MRSTAELRVLIAPQEFKGTLTAVEAAAAIERGLCAAYPRWRFEQAPMADGGPGTTEALVRALGGDLRLLRVHDPLMRGVDAGYGALAGGRAVIECAAASGLLRMPPDELTPANIRLASSYGTGELIVAALEAGVDRLIIGLGGSATNDGGAGMAQALGFRLLDAARDELGKGGAALRGLHEIDASAAHPALRNLNCLGATDVANPLCGPSGASAVYGPQKGADAAAIEELDAALAHFADIVRRDMGVDVLNVPGAGAAGGMGAGLLAFLGAELRSGAEVVGEAAGLEARVRQADLVITGEGRLDGQTAFGKAPQYVARLARSAGRPVICLAGSLGEDHESAAALFDVIEVLSEGREALPSPAQAADQLATASVRVVARQVAD